MDLQVEVTPGRYPEEPVLIHEKKTCESVTGSFYTIVRTRKLILTPGYVVNLRNLSPRMHGHSLVEVTAFFGVGEVLEVDELELSILLGESVDAEAIVFKRGTAGGDTQGCPLCRDNTLRFVTA